VALSGNLSEFSVLETLQVIGLQQKTGTLQILSGGRRHGLHFRDGALIGCQPTDPKDPDPFLDALVGLGQCGKDEERRIRMLAADRGTDLWRQIANSCKLEPETLEQTRALVLQGVLDRVLLWNKGHFEFEAGPVPPASGPPWNVEQAMLESMRRLDEAADLKSGDFPLSATAVPLEEPADVEEPADGSSAEDAPPPAVARAVLSRLDGKRSLGQLAERIGIAEYDILTTVRFLRDHGKARIVSKGTGARPKQLLLDQPRRLRDPARALFLGVTFVVLSFAGFQVHRITAGVTGPRIHEAREQLERVRLEDSVLQALEVFRCRNGRYPSRLDDLVGSGIWPSSRSTSLAGLSYEPVEHGAAYRWFGETIQPAAAATSSKTGTSGSLDPSPASTSRP
jgi:hypothetical protein